MTTPGRDRPSPARRGGPAFFPSPTLAPQARSWRLPRAQRPPSEGWTQPHSPDTHLRPIDRFEGRNAEIQYRLLTLVGALALKSRGLRKTTLAIGQLFPRNNAVVIRHEAGFLFRIYLRDPYWVRLLFSSYHYEPEIQWFMENILSSDHTFVDCGANTGYWTLFAALFTKNVVSIEASPTTFSLLQENMALNGNSVALINSAVYRESGKSVEFVRNDNRHAAAHIVGTQAVWGGNYSGKIEKVDTTTLNDLCSNGETLIIKLDIEGAEIEALRGCEKLWQSNFLIIYEDHGSDTTCKTSRYLLDGGFVVYSYYEGMKEIANVNEISLMKSDKRKGYNFFACSRNSKFHRILSTFYRGRLATNSHPLLM